MTTQRPNILFIFSDQQRWDTLGCYGQKFDLTPTLDAMAAQGTKFEYAFTCQPVCGPVRACLQTGKYAAELGCQTNGRMLPMDERTIAHHLGDAGYETAYIGKWHLASCGKRGGEDDFRTSPIPPARRGGYRDFWLAADVLERTSHGYGGYMYDTDGNRREFSDDTYRVDAQTDWAIEYLQNRKSDRPFFLFTSYLEPHHQNDRHCYEGPHGSKERYAEFNPPADLFDTERSDWRENYPDYLGCVNSLDTAVGRIRAELGRQGILDNTIIIYTSDHGSHFKTRNGEYKRSCHDGCIRVPMIIDGPGFRGIGQNDRFANLIDLPPTILSAAGCEVPAAMRGRDLAGALDPDEPWEDEIFLQISESHCGRAIRTPRWKYSVRADAEKSGALQGCDTYIEDFLYDLEADPHEQNNLVTEASLRDVRADLALRLKIRMVQAGEKEPEILCPCGSEAV